MRPQTKTLLVLGAGSDQCFMIQTAQQMGYCVVAVDANPQAPGLKLADYARAIDFSDTLSVIDYCHQLLQEGVVLSGISTMGSDIPHIMAAIAKHFGWPGPSEQTGYWATHKLAMKQRFEQMGIPIPLYAQVETEADIMARWREWGCDKLIIKPTDRAGSRGVRIIRQEEEVNAALTHAKSFSLNGEILLEEFIDGPQISTESIIVNEQKATPGFADRVYEGMECFWPNIMENGGWLPSRHSQEAQVQISALAERAASALGIEKGVAKGDIVVCPKRGPMIIEMAARLSGGDFSASLVPLSSGINYVKTVIDIALDNPVDLTELNAQHQLWVANRYFFLPPGQLEAVEGLKWIREQGFCQKLEFYPQISDQLPLIMSHANRSGVFVLTAETLPQLEKQIEAVYSYARFRIDGKWYSGRPTAILETPLKQLPQSGKGH
ncbi:ATP-grasp domain-containing protein [Shewanella insulae]|uniref:ATP-grasp domain-containing protein n=1 Tax=Shewanella insulae TaxID=2681496 RepID=UPI001EFDA04E|nr:ATP-grasp domain-containing protein [Shewanella insulae]MCG9713273.1 ATP-grasp domain-containing protein [Shewanella insulae]MCG9755909.1 ATP-grasp domain-containing protein [Shewanella insulae]